MCKKIRVEVEVGNNPYTFGTALRLQDGKHWILNYFKKIQGSK
jgi:hypothetical protein